MVESEQGWEQLLARRRQLEQEVAAVDKVSCDWSRDLGTRLSLVHSVPRTDRWLVQGEEELDDGGGHRDQADGGHAGGAGQDTERGKIHDNRWWQMLILLWSGDAGLQQGQHPAQAAAAADAARVPVRGVLVGNKVEENWEL